MLGWLYDIFVAIVSFVMGLFGFDLKKRSVRFDDEAVKKDEAASQETTTQEASTHSAPVDTPAPSNE
jgi:hypothetical protein